MLKEHNHWKLMIQPTPGEQRFFRLADDNPPRCDIFLADNSGPNPDMTDDGPLRVDVKRPMEATKDSRFYAPVISERNGGKYVVCLNAHEAALLVGLMRDLTIKWPKDHTLNLRALLDAPLADLDNAFDCDCCENLGFLVVSKEDACLNAGDDDAKAPIIIECDTCSSMKARGRAKSVREAEDRFWSFWNWMHQTGDFEELSKRYLNDMKQHTVNREAASK